MDESNQKVLYGLERFFLEISNLYDQKKLPNKILLSGKKGVGKATLAYHLINYFLSSAEDNKYNLNTFTINPENRSFKLISNLSHQNFYLVDRLIDKKNIDINQIRQMINYTNKSSFNDNPRFVLINNIEFLNLNSSNALLKVIEEPNENIFFILINNNTKNILPTLKSRCINFKINLSYEESIIITNKILNKNVYDLINKELISYYDTPGDIIYLISYSFEKKINLKDFSLDSFLLFLIDNKLYKKNISVKNLLINLIELYFFNIFKQYNKKNSILDFYHLFISKIYNSYRYNLDDESLFLEFKYRILNE